jgi:hypothetical protein
MPDPAYRLQVAILNREIYRLADRAGILSSARKYRPEWRSEDVEQELIAYLLHLTKNTKSGWDPARGAFTTWVVLVSKGWVSKLGRRQPEPTQPLLDKEEESDPEDFEAGNPESLLQAKQEARAEVLGPIGMFFVEGGD